MKGSACGVQLEEIDNIPPEAGRPNRVSMRVWLEETGSLPSEAQRCKQVSMRLL